MKYVIAIDDKFYVVRDVNFFKKLTDEEMLQIYTNNLVEIFFYETLKELEKRGTINENEIPNIPIDELLFTTERLEQLAIDRLGKQTVEDKRKEIEKSYIKILEDFVKSRNGNNGFLH